MSQREISARHYQKYKPYYKARRKEQKQRIRDMLHAHKDVPCMDCGERYPHYVMDLDHRDPTQKHINPAQMVNQGWGEERIQAELDKCDVVCANCHRQRTHG